MVKTLTLLMMEYEKPIVPLEDICEEYFGITTRREANTQAGNMTLPVPAFRLGGQRSKYMVRLEDLAEYIDRVAKEKKAEWEKMNAA